MTTTGIKKVDLNAVIRDKNPRLAKWLPRPLVSYLKRTIHEDEINHVLENYSSLPPVEFVRATLRYMDISYTAVGIERLDRNGRYIFASNHPFGGMDGMMLIDELYKYFGSGRIIINDILMNVGPMAPLFLPINKHGRQSAQYAHDLREALNSDIQIATFPAGLCSRRKNKVVCDTLWRPSFVKNAVSSERDVVPVYFEGRLSDFFYGLHNFRSALGIKANIEQLYLVDEMFSQRGKHFDIIFGEPVGWRELAAGEPAKVWSERIKERVYALGNSVRIKGADSHKERGAHKKEGSHEYGGEPEKSGGTKERNGKKQIKHQP